MTVSNSRGVLRALLHDTRANTLVLTAAAVVPMLAMAGSAIDIARLYTVKARLQQACDAGALAGRRFMTGAKLDTNAKTQANKFFANNFPSGWFLTTDVSFTPSDTSDGQVTGTALATVPMTIMGKALFGAKPVPLSATCEARLEITNADVMFVLDTTGSMACAASETSGCSQPVVAYSTSAGTRYYTQEKSSSKIVALRAAVLNFYDTLSAAVDSNARVRFGFVTYTSTVNVGYSLPSNYLVDSWNYESRVANFTTQVYVATAGAPVTGTESSTQNSSSACTTWGNSSSSSSGTAPAATTVTTYSWKSYNSSSKSCVRNTSATTTTYVTRYKWNGNWTYQQRAYNTSSYKAGSSISLGQPTALATGTPPIVSSTTNTVATQGGYNDQELAAASGWNGTTRSSKWDGCIEERLTSPSSSFDQTDLPADLDIDLLPTSDDTRWKPVWPDIVFYRSGTASDTTNDDRYSYANPDTDSPYLDQGYYTCGKPALKLATMTRAQVATFVNGGSGVDPIRAMGGTYHDTGMIWGARFISPTGIFSSENSTAPNGKAISRNIIFMTDGDMAPNEAIYGMYGVERLDRRVSGTSSTSTLEDRHNARFAAVCDAAKNKNITVWVVAFGQSMTTTLQNCASSGKAYYASNDDELETAFQNIAKQIADLRLSK